MIKIEKIEKDYLRCQSCNNDSQLNNISIGLNLNSTSSFRLCGDCLSFFSKEMNKIKIEKLQEQNKKLLSLVSRAYDFVEDGDFHHDIRKNWCKEAKKGLNEFSKPDRLDN